jgi:5-formyltetrahydrofolate cyclo-ligase
MVAFGIAEEKKQLRKKIQSKRSVSKSQHSDQLSWQLQSVTEKFGAKVIACYFTFDGEPDTREFLDWALRRKLRLILPRSNSDGSLSWVYFLGEVEIGIFGQDEPIGKPAELSEADLIFAPALAVDRNGNRLGKGLGYYDRSLGSLRNVFAVVFDDEIFDLIPHDIHDIAVSGAVTPTSVHYFSTKP